MNPYNILLYPVSTEKGIKLMESENKLLFVIDDKATKKDVKTAVESLFKVKVTGVNTFNLQGRKKAYVSIHKDSPAINIATQLGLI